MKIYTKKGDGGMTALATGEKVSKHDDRVDLYGTVDELNSAIGVAVSSLQEFQGQAEASGRAGEVNIPEILMVVSDLQSLQRLLFEFGAELAGYFRRPGISMITEEDVVILERSIDLMDESLEPLKSFILPGGTLPAAFLHLARTICRRLERNLSRMSEEHPETVHPNALKYINRLSDYLFTAARFANVMAGSPDVPWTSRTRE